MSLFGELKRRNVFRVGIAYVVVAWLLLQVADVVLNNIAAPGWVFKALLLLLALGLPLALVFAWAFEMTPEGVKREREVDRSQSITTQTGRKMDRAIIVVLILALGYFVADKYYLSAEKGSGSISATNTAAGRASEATENEPDPFSTPSIAVLPFINMSDDASNEYFSEGLAEELLNLLAKIPDLKVAARTSSFQFKGKTGDIGAIASQLKVANVLEGSVRKAGNQVRITAQLIKASDGYHLWSETYDRTLDNIFEVQDEIAAAVVAALKVRLLGEAPTVAEANPEAYTLYLQGRYLFNHTSKENLAKSVDAFEQAIALDPGYAPAWAGLALSTLWQAGQGWIEFGPGVARAKQAAGQAVELDPRFALGWVALARIQALYEWKWEAAQEAAQNALELEPNASYVLSNAGGLAQSLGQLDEAVGIFRHASALDPLNQKVLTELAGALEVTDRLREAEAVTRKLLALNPDYFAAHSSLAWYLLRQGKTEQALAEAETEKDKFWGGLLRNLALYSLGRHQEADAGLAAFIAAYQDFGAYQIAESHAWRNEPDEAFRWLERAREQHDPGLASLLGDRSLKSLHGDPRWPVFLEKMGLLEAWKAMPARYKGSGGTEKGSGSFSAASEA